MKNTSATIFGIRIGSITRKSARCAEIPSQKQQVDVVYHGAINKNLFFTLGYIFLKIYLIFFMPFNHYVLTKLYTARMTSKCLVDGLLCGKFLHRSEIPADNDRVH